MKAMNFKSSEDQANKESEAINVKESMEGGP
jgi:hypothetical protein